jgi:hypothetical protein
MPLFLRLILTDNKRGFFMNIRQFRFTLKHDRGIAKITVYGHSSIESATKFILDSERCPQRAILNIEDLSTIQRSAKTTLKLI